MSTEISPPAVALENPFPGLRPFREEEEHLFFGRESQVDRMVDKLAATRFLAVVGTSGSGKSSLVNCGLKPALHRGLMAGAGTSWRIVTFRPGGNPIRSMARAFAAEGGFFVAYQPEGLSLLEIVDATLNMSSLGLADLYEYAHLDPGTNLLVVVDQFEELFRYGKAGAASHDTYGVSDEAVAFINLLLEAHAHAEFPIYIVLTMRSDFLGECSQFDGLPEVINEGQYLVPRMAREERRAATSGPVGVVGGELSPALLTRLVNDVGDNPDQLSILQHAVNRTWSWWQTKSHGEGPVSLEHYEAVGAMAKALDSHADEAFGELTTERQQKICERVFKALTDKGTDARGIRRPMPLKTLCDVVGAPQEEVIPVLNVFREPSRSFLMPPITEPLEPDTVIDISHEILMRVWGKLRTWADKEAQSATTYRRLAQSAELHEQKEESLWRDPGLQVALEWRGKQNPNAAWAALYREGFEKALKFLDASKQVRDNERAEAEFARRWRRVTPVLGALVFIVFLLLSVKLSEILPPKVQPVFEKIFKPAAQEVEQLKATTTQLAPASDSSHAPIRKRNLAEALAFVLCASVSAVICIVLYGGLSFFGKRVYRHFAFAGIYQGISAALPTTQKPPPPPVLRPAAAGAAGQRVLPPPPLPETQLSFAGFWSRGAAAVLDGIVLLFLIFVVVIAIVIVESIFKIDTGNSLGIWIFLLSIPLTGLLYEVLMTLGWRHGTLGALACGLIIRTKKGAPAGFGRLSARFAAKFVFLLSLPFALALLPDSMPLYSLAILVFVLLAVLPQLLTPARQSLWDIAAGTVVANRSRTAPAPGTAAAAPAAA